MSGDGGRSEPTWYTAEVAETWEDIESRHKGYSCLPVGPGCYWIFRGAAAGSTLETKLERAFETYGVPHDKKRQYEMEMIREFQRKADLHKTVLKPGRKERNRILRELRSMNISTEVLFPDLSGFARSLTQQLAYVDIY